MFLFFIPRYFYINLSVEHIFFYTSLSVGLTVRYHNDGCNSARPAEVPGIACTCRPSVRDTWRVPRTTQPSGRLTLGARAEASRRPPAPRPMRNLRHAIKF